MKISVIVPVYNVEAYLEECLNSILQQNFQGYEIICVNDGSTDASGKILSDYEKKYTNIKVITHLNNKGLSSARNTGLKNAAGKYIVFIDSDDILSPNAFEELYRAAENVQADMVRYDYTVIYSENVKDQAETKCRNYYDKVYSGKELFCLYIENRELKTTAWSCFIRKSFLDKQKIWFYDGILHEDNLFTFLCMMQADKVIDVGKKYYIYRKRKGSIMDTYSFKRAESYFVIMVQVLTYWNSHIFSSRENKAIEYYFRDLYNKYCRMTCMKKTDKELEIGGYVEKAVYSIIYGKHKCRWLTLNETNLNQIRKAENVIVFGAGMGSMDIISILKDQDIKIDVIAVSDAHKNPDFFCGIKVEAIDHIAGYLKEAVVIIGVTEKYRSGICRKLKQLGYSKIILPESTTKC